MKNAIKFFLLSTLILSPFFSKSQIDESKTGAWYMYFYNTTLKESAWGIQGDVQLRNWNLGGDLEQLLIRSGLTYKPKNADIKFTLGAAHITTGAFGDSDATTSEIRIYQEALFPTQLGKRVYLNHRFRYEQRFVENQDFRTRYRYNLFINVPFNKEKIEKNAVYLALYNEIFINGERNIGNNTSVSVFDRNRFYSAIGYAVTDKLKVQAGLMNQTTNGWKKNQIQVSLHQKL